MRPYCVQVDKAPPISLDPHWSAPCPAWSDRSQSTIYLEHRTLHGAYAVHVAYEQAAILRKLISMKWVLLSSIAARRLLELEADTQLIGTQKGFDVTSLYYEIPLYISYDMSSMYVNVNECDV